MHALQHPQMPVALPGHFLYAMVISVLNAIFNWGGFGYTFFAILLIFGQALYLNGIANRYRLYPNSGNIVAFSYLTCTSIIPAFSFFSEAVIVVWCILGSIDILLRFNQTVYPRKHIFNAGFFLCVPALMHFPSIAYIVLLFVALSTLRSFSAGEWVVGLMGYLTPLYFFIGILFLANSFSLLHVWPHIGLSVPLHMQHPGYLIGAICFIVVLFGCGAFVMQQQMSTAVYVRRSWVMLVIYLLLSIIIAVFTEYDASGTWLLVMPGLSLVIAHAFSLDKSKWFSNFILYFSLLFVAYCQIVFK